MDQITTPPSSAWRSPTCFCSGPACSAHARRRGALIVPTGHSKVWSVFQSKLAACSVRRAPATQLPKARILPRWQFSGEEYHPPASPLGSEPGWAAAARCGTALCGMVRYGHGYGCSARRDVTRAERSLKFVQIYVYTRHTLIISTITNY